MLALDSNRRIQRVAANLMATLTQALLPALQATGKITTIRFQHTSTCLTLAVTLQDELKR
jgi:hypothetical protein